MRTERQSWRCVATGPVYTPSIVAHDKAYTSVSFKNDTIALEERGRVEIAPLSKLPHVMFFGGGVVIKLGDETIGAIGASGAPGAKLDDACARAGLDKIRDRLK